MRVLYVSHNSVLKEYQQKLMHLVRNHHVDLFLVTPPYWYEGDVKVTAFTGHGGIKYLAGDVVFIKKNVHFYKNPKKLIARLNPDIIHVDEEPFDFPCYQFIKAAKKAGKKTVFFTSDNFKRHHNFLRAYFDRYCVKNTDGVTAVNEEAKKLLVERGCDERKIHIITHGVNPVDFEPREYKPGKKEFRIAYIGRAIKIKGIDTLVEAVKDIENAILVIAGSWNLGYRKKIMKKIEKYGIQNRVEITGHMSRGDIPGLFKTTDIMVLPSLTGKRRRGKFGRVIVESFASRVPVIGSSSGEIPNVIADAGLVFEEGNAEDLKRKIEMLMKNDDLYRECMENGYRRMLENYTNEKVAEKIHRLYLQITEK